MPLIDLTKPPEVYIVCEDRKNRGRINVRICQERCDKQKVCQGYQEWLQTRQT